MDVTQEVFMAAAQRPQVRSFLHEPTSTFSYVVWDPDTRRAAVIDSAPIPPTN
jgi:hypothetical protein